MWITIKEQLINLNHISSIKWDERGDNLYLYLYRAKPHHLDNKFTFEWYIDKYNPEVTEEINHVSYIISNVTNTLKPIFNHDLADNGPVDDSKWKKSTPLNETVNPNAEFIGE